MISRSLNTEKVQLTAEIRHSDAPRRNGIPYANPNEVGRLARKLMLQFNAGECVESPTSHADVAMCAGYLVYAMEMYGYNFDSLCELADFAVAKCVAGLTPDGRLVAGPKNNHHCSWLSQGDVNSQIVKLAEIIAVCELVTLHGRDDAASYVSLVRTWADESNKLINAMTRLTKNKNLANVLRGTRAKIDKLIAEAKAYRRTPRPRPNGVTTPTEPFELSVPLPDMSLVCA